MTERDRKREGHGEADAGYEAPEVESAVTPEELEREVHYAGVNQTVTG